MFYAIGLCVSTKRLFPSDDMKTVSPNDVISTDTEIGVVTCVNVIKLLDLSTNFSGFNKSVDNNKRLDAFITSLWNKFYSKFYKF